MQRAVAEKGLFYIPCLESVLQITTAMKSVSFCLCIYWSSFTNFFQKFGTTINQESRN